MKKYLLLILIALMVPVGVDAADYYGCATASINSDNTFCTTPTGSCTGTTAVSAATALQAGNNLYANGCTLSITDSFTAAKISTEDGDGAGLGVAGGGFTIALNVVSGKTITANITAGSSSCLSVSGNAAGANPALTIIGNLTGSAASTAVNAVATNHINGTLVIGSSGTPSTIQGGGTVSAYAFNNTNTGATTIYANSTGSVGSTAAGILNTSTATLTITGTMTGSGGAGINNISTGVISLTGDCVGSDSSAAVGCSGAGAGAFTVSGNIINGTRGTGASGAIRWAPSSAQKYIKFNGGGTVIYSEAGLGSDAGGTQVTAANTAAEISTGKYFIKKDDGVYTQGTKSASGGGGAWGF